MGDAVIAKFLSKMDRFDYLDEWAKAVYCVWKSPNDIVARGCFTDDRCFLVVQGSQVTGPVVRQFRNVGNVVFRGDYIPGMIF